MSKNYIKLIIFLLLFLIHGLISTIQAEQKMVLVLTDPNTVILGNLEYLIESKKISLPNLEVLAIFHQQEAERFQESKKWASEHKISWIKWQEISGEVGISEIYKKNIWTEQFIEIFEKSDGMLIPGGPDLPPVLYGEKTNLLTIIERPFRHLVEVSFLFHLLGSSHNPDFTPLLQKRPAYTIFGICLGAQTINVATGGTLYQDIPTQVYNIAHVEDILTQLPTALHHRNYRYCITIHELVDYGNLHPILINSKNNIGKYFSIYNTPLVYSTHHQAIHKLGKNIEIWAMATDNKIVEGISHRNFPNVFGVQFHPEKINLWESYSAKYIELGQPKNTAELFHQSSVSVDFHQKLWDMFSQCMKDSFLNRK